MEFDIHFVIEHIKKLQQVHNTKLRTEISNIDDGMITYCFNINDDNDVILLENSNNKTLQTISIPAQTKFKYELNLSEVDPELYILIENK